MNTTQNLESQPIQTRKAYYSLQDEIDALRQSARQHEGAESYHDLMNLIEVNNQIIRALEEKIDLLQGMVAESVERDTQQSDQETDTQKYEVHLDLYLRTVRVTERLLNEMISLVNDKTGGDSYLSKQWRRKLHAWRYGINDERVYQTPKQLRHCIAGYLLTAYNARELNVHYVLDRTRIKARYISID